MIVYVNDVQTFISQCDEGIISNVVDEKMQACSRGHKPSEMESWKSSLPKVAMALRVGNVPADVFVAVEYGFELNDNYFIAASILP